MSSHAHGYAAQSATTPLAPFSFERRDPLPDDVTIDVLYCGVCHSDLHTVRDEWGGNTLFPALPGHEIVGRVSAVGSEVTRFKVGDIAAVGCMVDSCGHCASCRDDLEQFCENGMTQTYNSPDTRGDGHTFGGYSDHIVVKQHFVLKVPQAEGDLAAVAPLLCAGITTYSPLKHWNVGPGKTVGIVGIGGLGHMGIKIAAAMGAHVVAFTTSPGKIADAKALGAHEVVVSRDEEQMAAQAGRFDFILDTVAASHSLDPFVNALKRDGTLTLVGAPEHPHPSPQVFGLIFGRKSIAGSLIGGIAETQEMLDFCHEKGVLSEIEIIPIQEIDTAYDRMLKGDVKYRFVIDMASLGQAA